MVKLLIFGKDNTKQVVNMSNAVTLDQKNKPLSDKFLNNKILEIAQTIGSTNYKGHTVDYM